MNKLDMTEMDLRQQLKTVRGDEAAHRRLTDLLERIDQLEGRVEELEAQLAEQAKPIPQSRPLPVVHE